MKNKKITYKFDSGQEEYFYYWLEELFDLGYVDDITGNRTSFILNTSLDITHTKTKKLKTKELKSEHDLKLIKERSYTPDFIFKFNSKSKGIFYFTDKEERRIFPLVSKDGLSYVDTKGEYTSHYNSSITFGDRQAMMWDKHGIYVQIIKAYIREGKKCLFEETFTPKKVIAKEKYLKDISNKNIKKGDSKIKYKVRSLNEFIKNINNLTLEYDEEG
jgi:hypothetical protein